MLYEVTDEYSLWEYRILRKKWLEILKGDDPHSVYFQLVSLLDDNTKWRLINEVRRLQKPNAYYLHEMLDEWFWERQALGIRRITEEDDSKSRKSVFSVVRIIDEMIAKRPLITRANYMNSIERAEEDWIVADCERNFDLMSLSDTRRPDDCVSEKFLRELRRKVRAKIFEDIIVFANKFVAHSSDPESRRKSSLTLEKLDKAYEALADVIRQLSAVVLSNTHLALTVTRGRSVIEDWDSVFASRAIFDKLYELQRQRQKVIELWGT